MKSVEANLIRPLAKTSHCNLRFRTLRGFLARRQRPRPAQRQSNFTILRLLLATTLAIAPNSVSADVTVATATPNLTPELSAGDNLVILAAHHFKDMGGISPAEEILFRRTANGEPADFRIKSNTEPDPDKDPVNDPANARDWQDYRRIRASRLAWLCTDPDASKIVTPKGVNILGARIDELLDLAWAKVQFPLRTFKCAFTQDLVLDRGNLRSLQLQGTYLKSLTGDGLSVERDILIQDGSRVEGKLWLKEATIGGSLDCTASQVLNPGLMALNLNAAKLGADVVLGYGFKADGAVELVETTVGGVIMCDGGQFILPGKMALNLEDVKADAILLRSPDSSGQNPFTAHGQVWIHGASINGGVECDGGQFIETTIDALVVENTTVKGAMFLRDGFSATGQVKLRHSNIKGDLEFTGGIFDPGENAQYAIDANEIDVKGTVFFNGGFTARGPVWFNSANIGGSLQCGQGHFLNPRGTALSVDLAKIGGSVFLDDGFEADGKISFVDSRIDRTFFLDNIRAPEKMILDLTSAKATTLMNHENSWPTTNRLFLHGFVYDELADGSKWSEETQVKWIRTRSRDHFASQPYEQLATVFRNMGLQDEAVKVMIDKNDDHGVHPIRLKEVLWYGIFGRFIAYGYRPWNALFGSIVIIVFGYFLFKVGKRHEIMTPTKNDAYDIRGQLSESYPKFNAFIYSLETFVPLLKLGLEEFWVPNANRGMELSEVHQALLPLAKFWLRIRYGNQNWKEHCFRLKFAPPKIGSMLRCYLWFHIIAGWVLTTLWVGGFTGLLKT